ncbi:MAG: hypothetical protein Q9M31_05190 [Mariprofundus sp.]|nr:hypothetical protein [Mariprofundus sp.]
MKNASVANRESGFVLVTSLVLLSLLTLMSLAMFYSSRTAIQTSSAAQGSTEAYYYAETAVQYMAWALANDAEFDRHTFSGTYIHAAFSEPPIPANATTVGDYSEFRAYLWNPGPTAISDSSTGITGQVKYFDNSPIKNGVVQRHLCMQNSCDYDNCIDVNLSPSSRVEPSMNKISAKLPRYIRLDIDSTGAISPSIPSLPHHLNPVVGQDIPINGAITWLTAGDPDNLNKDIEIYPLDPSLVYGGPLEPNVCLAGSACPCRADGSLALTGNSCIDNQLKWAAVNQTGANILINLVDPGVVNAPLTVSVVGTTITVSLATDVNKSLYKTAAQVMVAVNNDVDAAALLAVSLLPNKLGAGVVAAEVKNLILYGNAQACRAGTGEWLASYSLVGYAIGYVNGRPSHMLRAVLPTP